MINILLIEYPTYSEVYFGWDFSNSAPSHVFKSRNDKVVSYFKSPFIAQDALAKRITQSDVDAMRTKMNDPVG